jgi:hypothetical protein
MRILDAEVKTKDGAILSSLARVWMVSIRIRSPSSREDSRIVKIVWRLVGERVGSKEEGVDPGGVGRNDCK